MASRYRPVFVLAAVFGTALLAMWQIGSRMLAERFEPFVPDRAAAQPGALTDSDKASLKGAALFSERFVKACSSVSADKDWRASPVSAYLAVSLVLNGAQGDTFDWCARTLGLDDPSMDAFNSSGSKLVDILNSQRESLRVASSLWNVQSVRFNPRFVTDMANSYGSDIRKLGSAREGATNQVVGWLELRTGARWNSEIVGLKPTDTLVSFSVMKLAVVAQSDGEKWVLTNPVGSTRSGGLRVWEFDLKGTDMRLTVATGPAEADLVQASVSMPAKHSGEATAVRFPHKRTQERAEVQPVLATLGAARLFEPGADLSVMAHQLWNGQVSRVVQFVDFGFSEGPAAPPPKATFDVGRHWFLSVKENSTGIIVYAEEHH